MATILSGFDDHTLPSFLDYPPYPSVGEQHFIPKLTPETQSNAVLSALKELQEKIRRLELGKSTAETKIKALVDETQKQKDMLNLTQESITDSRQYSNPQALALDQSALAHTPPFINGKENECLLSSQVENQLKNADARCKLLEKQLENMRGFVQNAEKERSKALELQLNLEREHGRMAAENHETRSKLSCMKSLQEKYSEMVTRKDISENKVNDLEQKLQLEKHQKQLLLDRASKLEAEKKSRDLLSDRKSPESKIMAAEKPLEDSKAPSLKKKRKNIKNVKRASKTPLPSHYHLNLNDIPFVIGTSTSPSHAVSANVQSLLHDLKHHSPLYCNENVLRKKKPRTINSKKSQRFKDDSVQLKVLSEADQDLNELLLTLQDEYGKLTYQYQLIGKQIDETYDKQVHDELINEQKQIANMMENKRDQISTLQRHKSLIVNYTQLNKQVEVKPKTKKVQRKLTSTSKSSSSPIIENKHKRSLNLLKEVQTVQSALHEKDLLWD